MKLSIDDLRLVIGRPRRTARRAPTVNCQPPLTLPSPPRGEGKQRRIASAGYLACVLLAAAALALGAAGCKPKQTVSEAGETVARYAKGMGETAGKLGVKAGTKLGLVEKKWDYVRLAYGPGETPARLRATYLLDEEREAGRALSVELIAHYGRYSDRSLDRYLNLVLASVSAFSDRPGLPCAVEVLASDEVRSFAAPGGYVFVTLGALRVAESESEIAGLLAQALAHSQLRHPLALLEGVAGSEPGARPVTQTSPEVFSPLIEEAGRRLVQQGFSREETRAAARAATTWLLRVGYEPGGLKAFMARYHARLQLSGVPTPPRVIEQLSASDQGVAERLLELHASELGRNLSDRYRRECLAGLPAAR